jgi:hypothetical protein
VKWEECEERGCICFVWMDDFFVCFCAWFIILMKFCGVMGLKNVEMLLEMVFVLYFFYGLFVKKLESCGL